MSANDRPPREEEYDEDPYDEPDRGYEFPSSWFPWRGRLGMWPYGPRGDDDLAGEPPVESSSESDESWWDEGLIGLLLVVGVVLFFFPEPATTALGVFLIAVGIVGWLIDVLAEAGNS